MPPSISSNASDSNTHAPAHPRAKRRFEFYLDLYRKEEDEDLNPMGAGI